MSNSMPLTARTLSILLLLVATAAPAGNAVHNLNFQHFGIRHGLPQTQVRVIHQDDTGYLWVGTYGGVGRYNGRGFRKFTTEEGLASNTVDAISSTPDGRVWVGTTNGLCIMDSPEVGFSCLQDGALREAHIQALLPREDGGMWIGTSTGLYLNTPEGNVVAVPLPGERVADITALTADTLSVADNEGLWAGTRDGLFRLRTMESIDEVGLPASSSHEVNALAVKGSELWIGTVSGLYVMRNGTIASAAGLPADWSADDVNSIAVDSHNAIWAATDQGILLQSDGEFELLTTNNGLKSNINFTVYVDHEGVVWLGNDDGLSKFTPGPFVGYTQASGLLHYFVRTINEDSKNRLWLGTRSGVQIVPYRDGEWRIDESREITAKDGLTDTRVYSIVFPQPGEAWLATGDGVVLWREGEGVIRKYDRDNGLPDSATQALLQQGENLWIGTNLGVRVLRDGEIHLPPSAALGSAYVYRIRRDRADRIWFGSQDRGLFMLDRDGEIHLFGEKEGLTNESIWDIAPGQHGGVWVGSNGDGLFHVGPDGEITRYTTDDGLVDNFVWQVLVANNGDVWTYTNQGISRFDGENFQNYGVEDGLLHLEGGATGAWQSHDGSLWFAAADGLMRYDEQREFQADAPPAVVIEEVSIGDRRLSENAELAHSAGNINFRYAALSFQAEDQLIYKYRLRGADDEWSDPAEYQPVTFANLGGGEYVFEVLARNPKSEWSKSPAQFHFTVAPAFWETLWFWAVVIPAFGLLIWAGFRMRIRQIELHRRELELLVDSRTEELKRANHKLQAASVTDPLTGLHNRRFLSTQIRTDVAQTRRAYRGPGEFPNRDIVFMMVDIDHFKGVNDTYGHGAGDRVLRQYADLLNHLMRESDYTVRWGGEEFLIVARQTEASQAHVIARRIMAAVREARFVIDENGNTVSCTCSVGVSHFPFLRQNPDVISWEQIVDISDIAVYMAKKLGRDGWVSIHGTSKMPPDDGRVILDNIRTNLRGLVREGKIEVKSSYDDPLAATPEDKEI